MGLRFHVELTRELIQLWTRHMPGKERAMITRDSDRYLAESNWICEGVIRAFTYGFQ